MKHPKKYILEEIEWIDAESDNGWEEPHDVMKWCNEDTVISEVGWIFYEDKKILVIVSQLQYDGTLGNRTKIPQSLIVSRRKLKVVYDSRRTAGRTHRGKNNTNTSRRKDTQAARIGFTPRCEDQKAGGRT